MPKDFGDKPRNPTRNQKESGNDDWTDCQNSTETSGTLPGTGKSRWNTVFLEEELRTPFSSKAVWGKNKRHVFQTMQTIHRYRILGNKSRRYPRQLDSSSMFFHFFHNGTFQNPTSISAPEPSALEPSAPEPSISAPESSGISPRYLRQYLLRRNPPEPHLGSAPSNPRRCTFRNPTSASKPEPFVPERGVEAAPDRSGTNVGWRPHSKLLLLGKNIFFQTIPLIRFQHYIVLYMWYLFFLSCLYQTYGLYLLCV